MARETGKQRSQRIQIDHFKQRGGLHYLRDACILTGLLASGAYIAYVLMWGGGSHISTGPVARAHAAFESNCSECHQDFTPIGSQAVKIDLTWAGVNSANSIAHLESACLRCHNVGNHYRGLMTEEGKAEDKNCGVCHVDHKGRDHDLNLVANRQCVSCHANLAEVCTGGPNVNASVLAFTKQEHGDFRSLRKSDPPDPPDPGKVKFNHYQHMLPGQVAAGTSGGTTREQLDPLRQDQYSVDENNLVQLNCADCHEMDGNPDGVNSLSFDAELGRYIAPISFEDHCSACHAMIPSPKPKDATPLPHAVSWKKIDLLLAATRAGAVEVGQARKPRDDRQATTQPGEGPGNPPPTAPQTTLPITRTMVQQECMKCHDAESITEQAIQAASESDPLIPGRWFVHGLYDHAIHREINCRYCHEDAYAKNFDGSPKPALPPLSKRKVEDRDHHKVMIAGIETCTGCHRNADTPAPESVTSPQAIELLGDKFKDRNWASDSCILCHRYHTLRDRPKVSATEATP